MPQNATMRCLGVSLSKDGKSHVSHRRESEEGNLTTRSIRSSSNPGVNPLPKRPDTLTGLLKPVLIWIAPMYGRLLIALSWTLLSTNHGHLCLNDFSHHHLWTTVQPLHWQMQQHLIYRQEIPPRPQTFTFLSDSEAKAHLLLRLSNIVDNLQSKNDNTCNDVRTTLLDHSTITSTTYEALMPKLVEHHGTT